MKATYTLTPKTLKVGALIHYAHRANMMAVVRLVIGGILFVMGMVQICLDPSPSIISYVLVALGLLNIFSKQIWIRRSVKKAFDGDTQQITMTFAASSAGIDFKGDKAKGRIKWKGFVDYVVHDKGLLLYPEKNLYHWIPKSAEFTEGDWAELTALVSEKVTRTV